MENNNKKPIELVFKEDLHQYLLSVGRIDERLPEAPDIETLWAKIGESYLPVAMREFGMFSTVGLVWFMFFVCCFLCLVFSLWFWCTCSVVVG